VRYKGFFFPGVWNPLSLGVKDLKLIQILPWKDLLKFAGPWPGKLSGESSKNQEKGGYPPTVNKSKEAICPLHFQVPLPTHSAIGNGSSVFCREPYFYFQILSSIPLTKSFLPYGRSFGANGEHSPCPLSLPSLVRTMHPDYMFSSSLNPESGTPRGSLILKINIPTLGSL
jgi:hypothetical protein